MDYTNLPKQTFADLIALRQAVVALINLLPEKEKELVKALLNRTAADMDFIASPPQITDGVHGLVRRRKEVTLA